MVACSPGKPILTHARRLVRLALVFAFGCAVASCSDDTPTDPGSKGAGDAPLQASGDEKPPSRSGAPDLEWVRHHPRISLLLVGGQRGKLKPCGCSEPQLGGIERLAALTERNRLRAVDGCAGLSLGWSLSDRGEPQAEAKASLYRAALELLGFQALVLGTTDLHAPALAQPFLGGRAYDLPAPPANTPLRDTGPLARAAETEPFAVFEVGGLTVRALSIIGADGGQTIGDVIEVVLPPGGALQRLTPMPEALWVVSTDVSGAVMDGLQDAMRRLGPAVIVDVEGVMGVDTAEAVRLADGPLVVSLATWGKQVGILDLDPVPEDEGGGWIASYHAVPLAPWLDETRSELRGRVTDLIASYKRTVRERGYLRNFGAYPNESGIGYVGSARCARCHPGIYEEWLSTPHARALRTLKDRGYDWDPECVRCHVVGFERFPSGRWGRVEGGFVDPRRTPHLGGVGCESCHGPGAGHVESPQDRSLWGKNGPNVRHPGIRGCQVCHDVENSFGFIDHYEDAFLPRADHREAPSDRRVVEPDSQQGPRTD